MNWYILVKIQVLDLENIEFGDNGGELFMVDDNLNMEELIEKYLNEILKNIWIDEENQAAVRQFLYYCENIKKTNNFIPFNLLVESFDIKKGIELARKMTLTACKILGCEGKQYTEKEFNEYVFKTTQKKISIAVITDMSPDTPDNWDSIFERLKICKSIIKIYVKNEDQFPRLNEDSFFRWRFLNLHVKKNAMIPIDAYKKVLLELNNKGYVLKDEFLSALRDYIETVYTKAKYQDEEFVADAVLAIEQRVVSTLEHGKVLGENAVPLYEKNVDTENSELKGCFDKDEESTIGNAIELTKESQTENYIEKTLINDSNETNDNPSISNIKSMEDYFNDFYVSSNSINDFSGIKKKNAPDEIRVLIFPLSIYPTFDGQMICNQNNLKLKMYPDSHNAEVNENYKYCYQLEPIFIKLRKELEQGQIDYIIIAVTDKTTSDLGDKVCKFISKDTSYEIPLSPFDFISALSSRIGLLNEEKTESEVINEKIKNYISLIANDSNRNNLRIIPVTIDQGSNIEKPISSILNIIKTIKNTEEKKLVLEYDNHGGSRDAQMVLESIMSLIENDKKIRINKYSITGGGGEYTLSDSDIGPLKFVSGITEFRKYGKIQTLREFYPSSKITKSEDTFIKTLEHISMGIQFNNQEVFSNGLTDLKMISIENLPEGSYLKLFGNEILDDYNFIKIESKLEYTIGMIKWCSEKGYFQQCLSIIESIVPYVLAESGIINNEIKEESMLGRLTNNSNSKKKGKNEEINTYVFNNVFMHAPYLNAIKTLRKNTASAINISDIINECKKDYTDKNKYKPHDCFNQNFSVTTFDSKNSLAFLDKHKELKDIRNNSNHPRVVIGIAGKYNTDWMDIEKIKVRINDYIKTLSSLPQKAIEVKIRT